LAGYMVKPFAVQELRDKVGQILGMTIT